MPQAPTPAHLGTSSAQRPVTQFRTSSMPDALTQLAGTLNSGISGREKYAELCINHGRNQQRLGEIEVSAFASVGRLFREIRRKYEEVRGFRSKYLLVEPVDIKFVQVSPTGVSFFVISRLLCIISSNWKNATEPFYTTDLRVGHP